MWYKNKGSCICSVKEVVFCALYVLPQNSGLHHIGRLQYFLRDVEIIQKQSVKVAREFNEQQQKQLTNKKG